MSDASEPTFSIGETKLFVSIIKNLTGDLQVCLLSFSLPLLFLALPSYLITFGRVFASNASIVLGFPSQFFHF
jgi:hypothetical protein